MPTKTPAPPEGYITVTTGGALRELPSTGAFRRDAEHRDPIPGVLVYAEGDWRPVVNIRGRFRRSVDLDYCDSPLANEQVHGTYQQRVVPERIAVTHEAIANYLAMTERIEADREAAEAARDERHRARRGDRQTDERTEDERLAALSPKTRREAIEHSIRVAEELVAFRRQGVEVALEELSKAEATLAERHRQLAEARKEATGEVLHLGAILAAGVPTDGVERFPDGKWIARSAKADGVHVVFGYDSQDDQGQHWWTGTRYVDHEAADTFSYPTLSELLDHVAQVTQ
jgi:hypothetical protein